MTAIKKEVIASSTKIPVNANAMAHLLVRASLSSGLSILFANASVHNRPALQDIFRTLLLASV